MESLRRKADYEHGVRMRGSWPTEDVAPGAAFSERKRKFMPPAKQIPVPMRSIQKKLVVGGLQFGAAMLLRFSVASRFAPHEMRWAKTETEYLSEIGAASKAGLAGPESKVLDFASRSKEQRHFPKPAQIATDGIHCAA